MSSLPSSGEPPYGAPPNDAPRDDASRITTAAAAYASRRTIRYPYFFWPLIALSLLALVLGAWLLVRGNEDAAQAASSPPIVQATQPAAAVDFALAGLDGKQVRLGDYRGKVVLLNFWATWCPPCKAEMPDLEALYRENAEKHGFVILAVDVEESADLARAFGQQYGLTFPLLPDPDGRVSNNRYFIRTLPTTFIVDRDGKVRYQWSGQQTKAAMLARLQTVW